MASGRSRPTWAPAPPRPASSGLCYDYYHVADDAIVSSENRVSFSVHEVYRDTARWIHPSARGSVRNRSRNPVNNRFGLRKGVPFFSSLHNLPDNALHREGEGGLFGLFLECLGLALDTERLPFPEARPPDGGLLREQRAAGAPTAWRFRFALPHRTEHCRSGRAFQS